MGSRHWTDDRDWGKLNQLSMQRVRHILGMESSTDADVLKDIYDYSLGTERPLTEYETFSGINFKDRKINGTVALEPPPPASNTAKDQRRNVFKGIFEQNGWGNKETTSGDGSTMAQTQPIRDALPKLFKKLQIETLGDAGC